MSLADLPKVELHLHLEGAAPPGFIRGLARERNVDIEGCSMSGASTASRASPGF